MAAEILDRPVPQPILAQASCFGQVAFCGYFSLGRFLIVKGNQASTHKKVVVRKLDQGIVKGFVKPRDYLGLSEVEVMDLQGHLLAIPLGEIKGIYFVRDFEADSDRQERKIFLSRPKLSGLWIRMTFKDSDVMDGLVSGNLLEHEPQGYLVTPPDAYSNNLKIFVPRSALTALEVLGVISNGARRNAAAHRPLRKGAASAEAQMGLFSAPSASES
jgi:Family of unknown function (DUF6982)